MPKSATLPQCEADGLLASQKVGFILNLFFWGGRSSLFIPPDFDDATPKVQRFFVFWGFFCLKLASFRQGQSKCNIDKLFNRSRTWTCALLLLLPQPCPPFLTTESSSHAILIFLLLNSLDFSP